MDTKNKIIKKYINNIKETSYNSVIGKLNKSIKKKGLSVNEKKNTKNIIVQLKKWKSNEIKKNEKKFKSSLKEFKINLENDFTISINPEKSTKSIKSTKPTKSEKLKKIEINKNFNKKEVKKINTKINKKKVKEISNKNKNKSTNVKIKEFTNKEIINLINKS